MLHKVNLSNLQNNPYRRLNKNALDEGKIERLKSSIKDTGFWGHTVVARPKAWRNDKPIGPFQIVFGHHRCEAARQVLGGNKEVEITVEDKTNDQMVQMMARENDEIYGKDAGHDIENVEATLHGLIAGELDIGTNEKTKSCKISDFLETDSGIEFSAVALSEYLGYPVIAPAKGKGQTRANNRISDALSHLRLIKENLLDAKDFSNMTPKAGKAMAKQAKKAEKVGGKSLVKKVVKACKEAVEAGESAKDLSDVAEKIVKKAQKEPLPDINEIISKLAKKISAILDGQDGDKLKEVIRHQQYAEESNRYILKMACMSSAEKLTVYAKQLDAPELSMDDGAKARKLEIVA